jgi:ribosome-associated translation inhibitor RaiA
MLIQVSGKGFELRPELRDDVEEKMATIFDRFNSRIGRVNVFLADENGPKHGLDKSIRIIIDIARFPLIVVEEKGESWHAILDQAAERATHTVSRQIDRDRSRTDRTSMAGKEGAAENIDLH